MVRLPPYHCDLNAIEFMWSLLKRRVASSNVGQEAAQIVKLTEEAFSSITPEDWKKQCEHVKNLEDQFYERDGCMDSITDKFIIELGNDSSTESDTTDDDVYTSDSDMSGIVPFDHNYCQ